MVGYCKNDADPNIKCCLSKSCTSKLTPGEEEILIQRILNLDTQGFPPRMSTVRETADLILTNRKTAPPTNCRQELGYKLC